MTLHMPEAETLARYNQKWSLSTAVCAWNSWKAHLISIRKAWSSVKIAPPVQLPRSQTRPTTSQHCTPTNASHTLSTAHTWNTTSFDVNSTATNVSRQRCVSLCTGCSRFVKKRFGTADATRRTRQTRGHFCRSAAARADSTPRFHDDSPGRYLPRSSFANKNKNSKLIA